MRDYHMHLERGALTVEYLERFLARARDILWTDYVASRSVNSLDGYVALIDQVRTAGFPVRFGLEADYVPGKERETERVLALFPLDYVIGSVPGFMAGDLT